MCRSLHNHNRLWGCFPQVSPSPEVYSEIVIKFYDVLLCYTTRKLMDRIFFPLPPNLSFQWGPFASLVKATELGYCIVLYIYIFISRNKYLSSPPPKKSFVRSPVSPTISFSIRSLLTMLLTPSIHFPLKLLFISPVLGIPFQYNFCNFVTFNLLQIYNSFQSPFFYYSNNILLDFHNNFQVPTFSPILSL